MLIQHWSLHTMQIQLQEQVRMGVICTALKIYGSEGTPLESPAYRGGQW